MRTSDDHPPCKLRNFRHDGFGLREFFVASLVVTLVSVQPLLCGLGAVAEPSPCATGPIFIYA